MPELPDLEVFAANLNQRFKNKKLEKVHVYVAKKLNVTIGDLEKALGGKQLKEIRRVGKSLHLEFSGNQVLELHLMLHGEIHLLDKKQLEPKFPILELIFDDESGFTLTDFQKAATPTLNPVESEVPDALAKDMNLDYLRKLLSRKRTQIKQVLLDQKSIRGIGNAYADEILWEAKISPFSIAKAIPPKAVKELATAIDKVLKHAISQIRKSNPDLISGEVRDFLLIHHVKNKKSPEGAEIKIDKKGNRKTYYTEEQKLYEQEQ